MLLAMKTAQPLPNFDVLSVQQQTLQTVTRYSYGLSSFCCCSRNCYVKHRGTRPSYLYANYTSLVTLRWRHFTAVHKDEIDDFRVHLNRQNADINFTKEIEKNGKIPFVDCLVTRDNKRLRTNICWKSTHTDRLLDQSSYNPISHKATTILTQFSWRLWHTNSEYYKEKFDAIAFGALRTQPSRIWSYLPSLTRLFKSWIAQSNR